MGNFWSSAKNSDQWNFTEDELQARYFDTNDFKPSEIELEEYAGKRKTQKKAEAHCAYMIPTLLALAADKPNLRILDVGCGSGEITIDFAELCPSARVIGMDVSGAVLDSARVYAERRGVSNVTFVQGSVYDMPDEWTGTFDVVHAHQAVAHFPERVRAIRELVRVARKGGGGIVCMREGDLRTARFHPKEYGDLEECFGVIVEVHEGDGGAADAGRRLRDWAVEAGVKEEGIVATQSVWRYDTPKDERSMGVIGLDDVLKAFSRKAPWSWVASFAMLHGEVVVTVT
ncbi:Putative Methyltransferase domain-containing protein [Septoria linicola]|uniref:Methyltransferase domain-containing protein n=1 Tax=Septoria linicola TaxID=215465 RepID=A0A9Q9EGN9_9PEZI|nr:Putative Methyltransferase domain-containing protein [Septoria linicola]